MNMRFVRRGAAGAAAIGLAVGGLVLSGGSAGAASTHTTRFGLPAPATSVVDVVSTTSAFTAVATPNRPRFWRETVRPGARDTSPTAIAHVYEVQIRLYRAGVYRSYINGVYGSPVVASVKYFQKLQKLPQTGIVDQATWARLIQVSTSRSWGWTTLPAVCKSAGFHACYSRYTYELFFLQNGVLWNSWMVRGGARGLQTVTGTYRVYWQDVDHRSHEFNNAPMPYAQFFYGGEAIHGSYTMVDPRSGWSHGCVNMYLKDAVELWKMTAGQRVTVTVYGPWR
jgi:hypothetical protein